MKITYEVFCIKDNSKTKNNVYVVADKETGKGALIDPACTLEQVDEVISSNNLMLSYVLITHTHDDHVRIVDQVVERYDCQVYVSRAEIENYNYHCRNLSVFDDNDVIWLGNTKVQCIITPGHTAGSACFLLENSFFTGDTIFIEGCGMCSGQSASPQKMFNSIKRIKKEIGSAVLVYPGHTYENLPGKPISYLMDNNLYFAIDDMEAFIDFRMRNNQEHLYDFI